MISLRLFPRATKRKIVTAITLAACSLAVGGADASDKKPVKFKIRMMADGTDQPATEAGFHTAPWPDCHLAFTSYTASTGGGVSVTSAYFATAEEADRYFQSKLDRAAKDGWEAHDANVDRLPAWRRVAVLSKSNTWQLMLAGGGTFRSFTASDRQILLEFEKQFIEPKPPKDAVSPK
jgi:hypothetical protein